MSAAAVSTADRTARPIRGQASILPESRVECDVVGYVGSQQIIGERRRNAVGQATRPFRRDLPETLLAVVTDEQNDGEPSLAPTLRA
jgi:hypothetical protein